jgi:hypothetical protein
MPKRTAAYAVSAKTQRLFVGLVVALVLLQAATIIYWVVKQYPSNHNLSAYLIPSAEGVLVPAIFFLTAYWLRRRPGGFKARYFDAALYGFMGVLLLGVISSSTIFYQQLYIFNGGYWRSILYTLAPQAVGYIIFVIFLLRYRD